MRYRPYIINAILLLVLGALIMLINYGPTPDDQETLPPLTGLTPARITTMQIERTGHPNIEMRRVATGWIMTTPYSAAVDADRISQFLQIAETAVIRQLDLSTVEPRDLGLTPVRTRLRLNNISLEFGITDPIDFLRYVQIDRGNRVSLIGDGFQHHLTASAEEFIDPAVFTGKQIVRIDTPDFFVERSGSTFIATQRGTGLTRVVSDAEIGKWESLVATRVAASTDASVYGELSIVFSANDRQTLLIRVNDEGTWLEQQSSGLSYLLNNDSLLKMDFD